MNDLSYIKQNFIDYVDNIIENNRVSHAYLIEVGNYDFDYKYIITFIKMILSNQKYDSVIKSDNTIFNLIDNDNYPDIITISTDTSIIKKSFMIDLQKEFNNKSLLDNKKIYIIKEAEKLNDSSANTILKFLEEPEDNIIAFLVTNNRYSVIDTIISRCQIISLKENIYECEFKEEIFDLMKYVFDPKIFFINYNDIMNSYYVDKNKFKKIVLDLENVIICYLNNTHDLDIHYSDFLGRFSDETIINTVSIIEDEILKLDYNVNYKLYMDSFFLKLLGG